MNQRKGTPEPGRSYLFPDGEAAAQYDDSTFVVMKVNRKTKRHANVARRFGRFAL